MTPSTGMNGAPAPRARLAAAFLLLGLLSPVRADTAASAVVYLSGDDTIAEGRTYREGDVITTSGGLMMKLPDGSDVELERNTTVKITRLQRTGTQSATSIHVSRGAVRSRVESLSSRSSYSVTTPIATAGVRGTDFSVAYEPTSPTATAANADAADIDVFEGTVGVEQDGQSATVGAGEGATVSARQIRRRAVLERIRERWQDRRQEIIERMRRRLNVAPDGDVGEALRQRLQQLTPEQREAVKNRLQQLQTEIRQRVRQAVENARAREAQRRSSQAPPPRRRPPGR